ncbi:PREDICTED: uncharacterized protein LOC109341724 [Lupinus angustifolius]|uniref:uncharacterized protein LOC109341724 n=1 Tax=Lupinus angustifolius TaxID=3871 RepID=UPI00092FD07E|nr:PREDICTED: uncharacterized protein LOC109341724 [Lupinus angustifolius]
MANPTNTILDPTNPYYMHPNENTGSSLVSSLLNEENYYSWSRAMTMALETKNNLEFVNGTLTKPPLHDQMFTSWKRCKNLVVSWLNHSIEPSIVQSVLWLETTQEIWVDLHQRYHQGDMFRISELIGEIHSIKQGNLSIAAFFNHMKGLWQQLDNYRPIPPCLCDRPIPPCLCEYKCACTIPTIQNYRENDYVICFLRGLNEQFTSVRSQIMLHDPLPPINKVFSTLVQQERQMQLEDLKFYGSFSSNYKETKQKGRGRWGGIIGNRPDGTFGRGMGQKTCTFCQRTGHTADTCYKKHGFPPNYQTNARNVNNYAGQASLDSLEEHHDLVDPSFKEENFDPILAFTLAQHNVLKNLIQESMSQAKHSTNQPTSNSIIATKQHISGATNHVCHSLSLYQNFKRIKPLLITLPNGNQVIANYSGTVVFSNDLYLTNVFQTPHHYAEAIKHECWQNAIQAELKALANNNTWRLTTLPNNKRAIGCKWVFKIKHNPDGSIERHKAKLVANGFNQTEGVDYMDTFSPVVKMTTIRVLLCLAALFNWHMHQLDINTTFLHGYLKE